TPTEHTRHQWGPAGARTGAAVTRYNDKISVAANVASGSRSAKYPPRRASSSAASNPSPVVSKRASTVGGDINAILPPWTTNTCPLIRSAAGEARYATNGVT